MLVEVFAGIPAHRSASDRALARLIAEIAPRRRYAVERACPRCGSSGHGPPRVVGAPLWASVSRAGGLLAAAVGDGGPVGVDIELPAAASVATVTAVALHPDERADDDERATRTWVRKEAVLKALGVGLTVDPRRLRLSGPDEAPRVLGWEADGIPTGPVWLADLPPDPRWVGAVAVVTDRPARVSVRAAAGAPG